MLQSKFDKSCNNFINSHVEFSKNVPDTSVETVLERHKGARVIIFYSNNQIPDDNDLRRYLCHRYSYRNLDSFLLHCLFKVLTVMMTLWILIPFALSNAQGYTLFSSYIIIMLLTTIGLYYYFNNFVSSIQKNRDNILHKIEYFTIYSRKSDGSFQNDLLFTVDNNPERFVSLLLSSFLMLMITFSFYISTLTKTQ